MPYAPGIEYRGDQYLYQGISGAADSIGSGITALMQRTKQLKATRQMAIDGLGMDQDQVNSMSLPQLQGKLAGEALKRSNVGQNLVQKGEQLKNQATLAELRRAALEAGAQAAFNRGLDYYQNLYGKGQPPGNGAPGVQTPGLPPSYGGPPGAPVAPADADGVPVMPPPGAPTGAGAGQGFDLDAYMNRMQQANLPIADQYQLMHGAGFLARVQHENEADAMAGKDNPIEAQDLPGGWKGFRLPGTKQMDIRPDLTQSGTAQAVQDEDGNAVGQVVNVGGKSIFKPAKPAANGQLQPVLDPQTKQPIPGLGMDAAGKVHDYRDQMQKAGVGGPAPAGAATPAVPKTPDGTAFLPKTKADYDQLPSGSVYLDPADQKLRRKQ